MKLWTARAAMSTAALLVLAAAVLYFQPMRAGSCGERSVVRFRLQVFTVDCHDYGDTSWRQVFFETDASEIDKYGCFVFYDRLGGPATYFGIEEIRYPAANSEGDNRPAS